jgi:hypothetical protein
VAAELLMMNFKLGHRSTFLAPPTVTLQDPLAESLVNFALEP